jgi:Fe-S-cluster containining protein
MTSEMATFRFELRSGLVERDSALHDQLTGVVYPLTDVGGAVVTATRVPHTADELLKRLSGSAAFEPSQVERELRQMLLLGFFEGTCASIRERLEQRRLDGAAPVRVLAGSRFGCGQSGACCRGYVLGPVSASEKARIEALAPHTALPHLDDRPLFVEGSSSGEEPVYQLATIGDTCVFLEQGLQCGLHRAFGADAKPRFCRLYPLATVATVDGLKVYDRGECATFAISSGTGPPIEDLIASVGGFGDEAIYHPPAQIHGALRCDYGSILALARRLDDEACGVAPLDALQTIGHIARGFAVALHRCPLEAGEPEATVEALLARPLAELRPPEAVVATSARDGLRNIASLCSALAERAAASERFTAAFLGATELLSALCRELLDDERMSTPSAAPLDLHLDERTDEALTRSLRHQLFGRELLLDESLPGGLLRMGLVVPLTLAATRRLGFEQRRSHVSLTQLSVSHMVVKRTLQRPEPHKLLAANGEKAWSVLDALPLLAARLAA